MAVGGHGGMRLELLPTVLGALALGVGVLGGVLAQLPTLRRRWPRLGRGSLGYLVAGALLLAGGWLAGVTVTPPELVTVTFESDPSGAEVLVGSRSAGYTPLQVQLLRGVTVPYRVVPGERVLLPGRFASYAGAVTPSRDTRLAIWLDRLP